MDKPKDLPARWAYGVSALHIRGFLDINEDGTLTAPECPATWETDERLEKADQHRQHLESRR